MGSGLEASGGSAANTIAGIASLGGKAAYIGKVADDLLGKVFAHDMRATGVRYDTQPLKDGPATARCLILVTPDAQRTMSTFLGASVEFQPGDVDRDLVASAQVTYLEGYLFDRPLAKEAFRQAGAIAHQAGRKVSLTLSDPFCVDRHRADFRDLIRGHVDILFANEAEICSLYETKDFDQAATAVRLYTRRHLRGVGELLTGLQAVLLERAREAGLAGATVWRAIEGFSAGGHLRADRLPDLARGLPLVVEIIDGDAAVSAFLPTVRALAPGALLTSEAVHLERPTEVA